jgi:acyl carrier protein
MEESAISDETSAANTENWDSFNTLMLVSELEKEFQIRFAMDEMIAFNAVKNIKELLKRHGVNLE